MSEPPVVGAACAHFACHSGTCHWGCGCCLEEIHKILIEVFSMLHKKEDEEKASVQLVEQAWTSSI